MGTSKRARRSPKINSRAAHGPHYPNATPSHVLGRWRPVCKSGEDSCRRRREDGGLELSRKSTTAEISPNRCPKPSTGPRLGPLHDVDRRRSRAAPRGKRAAPPKRPPFSSTQTGNCGAIRRRQHSSRKADRIGPRLGREFLDGASSRPRRDPRPSDSSAGPASSLAVTRPEFPLA